jgi:hypothetical protein
LALKEKLMLIRLQQVPKALNHLSHEEMSLAFSQLMSEVPPGRHLPKPLQDLTEAEWMLVALTLAQILEEAEQHSLH